MHLNHKNILQRLWFQTETCFDVLSSNKISFVDPSQLPGIVNYLIQVKTEIKELK